MFLINLFFLEEKIYIYLLSHLFIYLFLVVSRGSYARVFFYHMGSGGQTQVIRCGSKQFDSLSYSAVSKPAAASSQEYFYMNQMSMNYFLCVFYVEQ